MAARNSRHNKRLRRVAKMVSVSLPAYIDLVQWLRSHGHATSAGAARKIIAAGRVKSESHVLGKEGVVEYVVNGVPRLMGNPRVPAHLRSSLYVTAGDDAGD